MLPTFMKGYEKDEETHGHAGRRSPAGGGADGTSAKAYNESHPERVEQFNRLTDNRLIGSDGGVDQELVALWQREHGLVADGKVGSKTIEAAKRSTERRTPQSAKLAAAPTTGAAAGESRALPKQPTTEGSTAYYKLHLELLHQSTDIPHASRQEALHALWNHQEHISQWIDAERDGHRDLMKIHDESSVVAAASELAAEGREKGVKRH